MCEESPQQSSIGKAVAAALVQLGWLAALVWRDFPASVFLLTALLLWRGDEANMVHLEFYSSVN